MSQNTRNQPGDGQGSSGRESTNGNERKRYEGFDGMNYEQVRRPFYPRHTDNDRGDLNDENTKRRNEL